MVVRFRVEFLFSSFQMEKKLALVSSHFPPSPSSPAAAKSLQLCPTLSHPMNCSLPSSSIHGIFQAKVLEWGAIAFSALQP